MEIATIQKQIRDRNINNFYIFTGEEVAVQDIYVKKIIECSDISCVRADTVKEIIPKLNNRAFIKTNNCYIVHNDMEFIKAETSWNIVISSIGENILILIYDNLDKRGKFYKRFVDDVATFERLSEDMLVKYIQKDIDLSVDNCKILINVCDFSYNRILLEIDKIKQFRDSYVKDKQSDKPYDGIFLQLLNDGTIYRPPQDAIFDLVDSICRGSVTKSFRLYEDCKAIDENPLAIISVLYNNMKQMLQVQSCGDSDVCKTTGLSGWIVQQAKDKIGAYTVGELVKALKTIQKVETQIKTGEIEQDISIDYIMLSIWR